MGQASAAHHTQQYREVPTDLQELLREVTSLRREVLLLRRQVTQFLQRPTDVVLQPTQEPTVSTPTAARTTTFSDAPTVFTPTGSLPAMPAVLEGFPCRLDVSPTGIPAGSSSRASQVFLQVQQDLLQVRPQVPAAQDLLRPQVQVTQDLQFRRGGGGEGGGGGEAAAGAAGPVRWMAVGGGRWVARQRSAYKEGTISPECAAQLEAIGFNWKLRPGTEKRTSKTHFTWL